MKNYNVTLTFTAVITCNEETKSDIIQAGAVSKLITAIQNYDSGKDISPLFECSIKEVVQISPEDFTRVNSDTFGNPRYVCHYTNFIHSVFDEKVSRNNRYALALKRAKKFGGRKFNNKQYGGGIVFQSYSIESDCKQINEYFKDNF